MNIWILAVYFQILDLLTTILFMTHGIPEFNPITRFFIMHFGLWGLIFLKVLLVTTIVAMYFRVMLHKNQLNLSRVISRVNYFYSVVVGWNICSAFLAAISKA